MLEVRELIWDMGGGYRGGDVVMSGGGGGCM